MAQTPKAGRRHTLLLYRRIMDRLWAPSLVLGLLLLGIEAWSWFNETRLIEGQDNLWILVGSAVLLAFSLFAFFGRKLAYVQAQRDHIRLVTPFLKLRISYRRIRSAHPSDFSQMFPPKEAGWAEKQLLEPFYGMTVVVLDLTAFPLPPAVLRFFLAPQMFSRHKSGLVLTVADWMALSTEIDTLFGAWLRTQGRR
jgi:hypothetical protein